MRLLPRKSTKQTTKYLATQWENDARAEARAKGIEALTCRAATVAFSTEFLKFVEEDQGIEPDTKRFLQAGLDALSADVLTSVYAHNHSVMVQWRKSFPRSNDAERAHIVSD